MAMRAKMTFPADDDDDLDVEALRMAALQTLKKSSAPPLQIQKTPINLNHVNNANSVVGGSRVLQQNRGRGRGVMGGVMRRGMHRGRGGYPPNFFPNSRPSGNSNLITIVPTVPDDDVPHKGSQQPGSQLTSNLCGSTRVDSTEEEKVPAKFRRLDDDSESEESDDDPGVKAGSEGESSGDEDEKENEARSAQSDTDSEKDDLVTLQNEEEDIGDDNSLERLMRELEDEISDTPKEKKPVASTSTKEKPKMDKVPKLKKTKRDKRKKDKTPQESCILDVGSHGVTSLDKPDGTTSKCDEPKSVAISPRRTSTPTSLQISKTQSRSPQKLQAAPAHGRSRSPRAVSPISSSTLPRSPPRRSPSPRAARSPQRLRSPGRSRSPRRSRSPLRSPLRARSPRRSPPRVHYAAATRPGSRSPYRSPRRSPHYLPPRTAASPSRLPLLRSRSRSPRLRSRSPGRMGYGRRSRSRSPLAALRPSPSRRVSPYRRSRSRSRSPGGRLYSSRRSRSLTPRGPLRRSPSPRGRRSPLYVKKLSPKRRSISPRRRSISPRRRTPSPRRRSVSPRRRSVSPRRRPVSPGWSSRPSPPRSRSPIGAFRPLSPRRRSPLRRSPSPAARKYSPPVSHRGGSPARKARSPSPVPRAAAGRRRSPAPVGGAPRRLSPHHRPASPSFRRSPPKQSHVAGSPGRVREKPRQLSPLPPASRSSQRLPSPRRQRSPVPYSRGHHSTKPLSPARKVSPSSHSLKRPLSPPRNVGVPPAGREPSPSDSISLSPSPERQPASKGQSRGRKSHPLGESHSESKKSRTDLRSVLPRRRDLPKDDNLVARPEEPSKRERKKEKQERREKRREREKQKRAGQETSYVLEARRRKFESGGPVEISGKKIRLRNMASEAGELEEQEISTKDVELNIEKEKERELKEVNEVDESILDRELMGGVDLLWSDEEEEEEEEGEEEEEEEEEAPPATSNVQFKRTFNLPSSSSGKENIPDDSSDSKKDEEEEEPTSTTGSPDHIKIRDESDQEECEAISEKSVDFDDCHDDKESQDAWPKTNRELKEFIMSQAKGATAVVRFPKHVVRESHEKRKCNESDVDLRAELSRRRAERLTKVNNCVESLPGRLLQSALQGVGVKSRREKGHRRRTHSPSFEDDTDQQEGDGRRVLVLRRAPEQKEPAINVTISKVDSSKESNTLKISGKLPIHMRLGTGKKGDDSSKKVNLKRNVTVGRKKQV